MGEPFSTSEQTLKKRLYEKEILASIDEKRETLTIRRTIAGSQRNVLHLRLGTLLPVGPEEDTNHQNAREEAKFVR
jgi:hypothetical protein